MAGSKKPTAPRKAAKAADTTPLAAAQQILSAHMPAVLEIMASSPIPYGPSAATVALPMGSQQTLMAAVKVRPNWYLLPRRELDQLARLVVERNWFARPVHQMRVAVYGAGFRFKSKETRDWVAKGNYPFRRYQKDMIEEWHVSRSIVVWWRKDAGVGELPVLNVPNAGDVEYDVIGGIPQISVRMGRKPLTEESKAVLGDRLWEAIRKGGKLVITGNDKDFDFRVMKEGKSTSQLPVTPLVTIFDDLDFVEAVKVGDWNGAKSRWEILRHTKKGYAVTSGSNGGTPRTNAKSSEIKEIMAAMKAILGKQDMVTNFDHEISWLTFPKEHFHEELLREVKQRLLFWSGVFGVLLLKTDSQIQGLSAFMMDQLRGEVLAFREEFSEFLCSIYQAPSFRGQVGVDMELVPQWSVKPLYSLTALISLATAYNTYGIGAPQTVREMFDIDDDEESDLMKAAHEDPLRYTPVFEPRQGITAAVVAPEPPAGNQNQNSLPGAPGRPANG